LGGGSCGPGKGVSIGVGGRWEGAGCTFRAVGSVYAGYHLEDFCEWCGTERSPFLPNFFVLLSDADMVGGGGMGFPRSGSLAEEIAGVKENNTKSAGGDLGQLWRKVERW
jgi:hypothetical protein